MSAPRTAADKRAALLGAWRLEIENRGRPTRRAIGDRARIGPNPDYYERQLMADGALEIESKSHARRGRVLDAPGVWSAWSAWSQKVERKPPGRRPIKRSDLIAAALGLAGCQGKPRTWQALLSLAGCGVKRGQAEWRAVVEGLIEAGDLIPPTPAAGFGSGGRWSVVLAGARIPFDLVESERLSKRRPCEASRPRQVAPISPRPRPVDPGPLPRECQWIDGDPLDGAGTCGDAVEPGRAYCPVHMARAYRVDLPGGGSEPWTRAGAARAERQAERRRLRAIRWRGPSGAQGAAL